MTIRTNPPFNNRLSSQASTDQQLSSIAQAHFLEPTPHTFSTVVPLQSNPVLMDAGADGVRLTDEAALLLLCALFVTVRMLAYMTHQITQSVCQASVGICFIVF
eukprot:m.354726 g.354726  ORF g.354726 m.354726 type:complete len:104 (+) comp17089_c0_seq1:1224-1535(+)